MTDEPDMYIVGTTTLRGIHSQRLCAGRGCVVHAPSSHHMRGWPVRWRDDRGFVTAERVCMHHVGHPDPDDLAWQTTQARAWLATHGCDGCCAPNESAPAESGR
jgi:hypothetical protein